MNMAYCRFQNTTADFRDCANALEDLENGETTLSREELSAAKTLAVEALDLVMRLADYVGKNIADMDAKDVRIALDAMQERASKDRQQNT